MAVPLFSSLEGAWTLSRTIPGMGSAWGTASFRKEEEHLLHYREEGRFRVADGDRFAFFRTYLCSEENGAISVFFDEVPPRLFHVLRFETSSRASATHRCGEDECTSIYQFINECLFRVCHKIRGPKKNFEITTAFLRKTPHELRHRRSQSC